MGDWGIDAVMINDHAAYTLPFLEHFSSHEASEVCENSSREHFWLLRGPKILFIAEHWKRVSL